MSDRIDRIFTVVMTIISTVHSTLALLNPQLGLRPTTYMYGVTMGVGSTCFWLFTCYCIYVFLWKE